VRTIYSPAKWWRVLTADGDTLRRYSTCCDPDTRAAQDATTLRQAAGHRTMATGSTWTAMSMMVSGARSTGSARETAGYGRRWID
jgi:hypothetical protein